jgi:hypothetical protein
MTHTPPAAATRLKDLSMARLRTICLESRSKGRRAFAACHHGRRIASCTSCDGQHARDVGMQQTSPRVADDPLRSQAAARSAIQDKALVSRDMMLLGYGGPGNTLISIAGRIAFQIEEVMLSLVNYVFTGGS